MVVVDLAGGRGSASPASSSAVYSSWILPKVYVSRCGHPSVSPRTTPASVYRHVDQRHAVDSASLGGVGAVDAVAVTQEDAEPDEPVPTATDAVRRGTGRPPTGRPGCPAVPSAACRPGTARAVQPPPSRRSRRPRSDGPGGNVVGEGRAAGHRCSWSGFSMWW